MLDGKELTIGVSGMLRKNALVMYDRETETLWASFTGEALAGPLMGKTLKILESTPRVSFGAWKKAYPDTKVLSINGVSHSNSRYERYFNSDRTGMGTVENTDGRLGNKVLIVGVVLNKKATAVPLDFLNDKGVVKTKLDGKDIVIYADIELGIFGAVKVPKDVDIKKIDGESLVSADGRKWSTIDGSGKDSDLEMLPALRSFWFAWGDHYPETGLITK